MGNTDTAGYFNFSNEDKLQVTQRGSATVYGKDNKSYWYTGITSSGKDESAVGFVLVDTRTRKKPLFYKQGGAVPNSKAQEFSPEGKVKKKNILLLCQFHITSIPFLPT